MPQWNINVPYCLLDERKACGLQVVIDDTAAAFAAIPVIWEKLQIWKKNVGCAVDDCSLELAGVRFFEKNDYVLRWGLLIRLAVPAICESSALSAAARKIKGFLCAYLNEAKIQFGDIEDDEAVLAHYPVWNAGTADDFWTGSFAKQAELIGTEGKQLTWYRELHPDAELDIPGILRVMERHAGCGLSLEMHALPDKVCRRAEEIEIEDKDCAAWLAKIADGGAASVRLMFWGDRAFAKAIWTAVHKQLPLLEQKQLRYTNELSSYMVYDPWAYTDVLVSKTASRLPLGSTKYALTLDEMQRLCAPGKMRKWTEPMQEAVLPADLQMQDVGQTQSVPAQPVDQTGFAQEVAEVVVKKLVGRIDQGTEAAKEAAKLARENNEQLRRNTEQVERNTKQLKQNTEAVEKTGEEIRQNTQVLRQIIMDIGEMSGKMDKLAELAETCEKIVPAGCEIAFAAQELEWMEVESEAELCTKYGMEESAVRLLKTALTLARLGMDMDENDAALMAFSTPLGAVYEYMVQRYFKESVYNKLPDSTNKKKKPQLGDFDHFQGSWPIADYERHSRIDGEKQQGWYWRAWLNIMRVMRNIRNKVHFERGEASKAELRMMYDVLIAPGVQQKLDALKYGESIGELYPKNADALWRNIMKSMEREQECFTSSLFHFLLKCGKAEWV